MKERVLCFFALVFEIILLCTAMSYRVEEIMTTKVVIARSDNKRLLSFPKDILYYDSDGCHLYEVYNSEGWESGLRAKEIEQSKYSLKKDKVMLTQSYGIKVIGYASRPVRENEPVVVEVQNQIDDKCLVFNVPDDFEYDKSVINNLEYSGGAHVVSCKGRTPFFESQFKSQFSLPPEAEVYSCKDIDTFRYSLRFVALAVLMLVVLLIIWGYGFTMTVRSKLTKKHKLICALASVFILLMFTVIINYIEIPASLLPEEYIFELSHYYHEWKQFSRIY